ncbi:MAG TPA: hypothetical protein VKT77_17840, partial [Chthonomonadaceae bacterium]|nr:hypothetical protein [Chthonomonadaceae bacterium]
KTQMLRWSGVDPDNDTLTYEVFYSDNGGADWKPLPLSARASAGPGSGPGAPTGPAGAASRIEEIRNSTTLAEPLKQILIENIRRETSGGAAAVATRDNSKQWDTTSVPDGVYQLKVIASDRLSNPTDPLTATAISEPFTIANALPKIGISGTPVVAADRTVTIRGIASQALVGVVAVQVRVDGGDWIAAVPQDGLFDGPREPFQFVSAPLTPGKHTLDVEAFNAAGQKALEKVEVVVR